MSRREAWASAGLIFVVALVVRAWAAAQMPFPTPEDATYYWGAARNLMEGNGLTSNALWSYVTPARDASGALSLGFPRPAFEIWLPLPALLAAIPMALMGSGAYGPALLVPVLVGALVPVLAWRIGADLAEERSLAPERARALALGSGLVAAAWLPLVLPSAVLDSTSPYAVPALAACLLMVRLAWRPPARLLDGRVIALGAAIGIAYLSRNEAAWIGLTWLALASCKYHRRGVRATVGPVAVAGLAALLVMSPWLVRSWLTFGSPLPGQAALNAFSLTGYDIFAWADRPTLARYLAAGAGELLDQRLTAFGHNLVDVLLVPGFPISLLGLIALPWTGRARALRPLLLASLLTFWATTLLFPVATTWGTFLHAAVPALVLLLVAGLAGLDAGIAAAGRKRGWTRPVAWLGPLFLGFAALLFVSFGIPSYSAQAGDIEARYAALGERFAALGDPLDPAVPVIANHPMWLAEANRIRALALPDEPVSSVLEIARTFGARYVVLDGDAGGWPARLATDPDARCLAPVTLPPPAAGQPPGTTDFAVYRVACP
jgi:hypothetical protein